MRKIAVIGLGIMGHGIADNFLKNGYEVYVWNRHADKAKDLKDAKIAGSPKEATEQADIIFEVTASDESSRGVWLGKDGIMQAATVDKFLITCATLSVKWTEELAKRCAEKDLTFFDMPMTGTRMGAESGQLTLFVGGDEKRLGMVRNDLKAITKEVKYFGPNGSGMKFKLILNTTYAIHLIALGQAIELAKTAGLDVKKVGDQLAEMPGGTSTNLAWAMYQKEPDPINFSVEWIDKDLHYAREMAKNGEYPMLEAAIKKFDEAVAKGYAEADWTKVNRL